MTRLQRWTTAILSGLIGLTVAGCGGGASAKVGGAISGLGSGLSLTIQDNNTDNLTLTANGAFSFTTELVSAASYDVTILTQPAGQTCTVASGTGTIDANDDSVNTVAITCTTTASLGGTISGLLPGTSVTLNDVGTLLTVAANGGFAFPGTLSAGTAYNVTVNVQPAGQSCTVANPAGKIVASVESLVTVTCQ